MEQFFRLPDSDDLNRYDNNPAPLDQQFGIRPLGTLKPLSSHDITSSIAGIGMESFVFVGFLKGKKDEKLARLAQLKNLRETLVFYAAPHHLREDLALMAQGLGDRRAALVREISKLHQERIEGTLASFCDTMPEEKIRGEFVCVVEGARETRDEADESDWREEAAALIAAGASTKAAAEEIASRFGVQKNSVKKFIIENCIREA